MNKQEILSAIAEKIAGQGNQVDIGGALGPVFNAIVELIPDSPGGASIEVDDITKLTGAQLDALNVGDKVIKKVGGSAKYLYVVSYKDDAQSGVSQLQLTYTDSSNVETVYYLNEGSGWAYEDTDTTEIG